VPAAAKCVERPHHAGRATVEDFERVLHAVEVRIPVVDGPERGRIERRLGIGNDRRNRILDARRNPRLVDQGLELFGPEKPSGFHQFLLVDPGVSCRQSSLPAAR
jgi:hypothetical protein